MAQPNKGPALEPIDLPPAIEQGVDMIYIDEFLVPRAVHNRSFLAGITDAAWSTAPVDLFTSVNPIYTDLRRGLVKYVQSWGSLPQIQIPSGPTLKSGSTGDRVAMLRTRLGLADGTSYDAALAARVKDFQDGSRPQGRRDRGRRHDRRAQPRCRSLRAADHHQHGAREAPPRP